jgi:hypothetical protein
VFLGRSPDTGSFEDVRRYQLHLAASEVFELLTGSVWLGAIALPDRAGSIAD